MVSCGFPGDFPGFSGDFLGIFWGFSRIFWVGDSKIQRKLRQSVRA
jgi:hypothetical protein